MDDNSCIIRSPLFPILERSFEGVAIARPDPWRIVYANPTLAAWLGGSAAELPAGKLEQIVKTTTASKLVELASAVWDGSSPESAICGQLLSDGARPRPVELRLVRLETPEEPLLAILVREAEAIRPQTAGSEKRRDPLTGLHDRAFLLGRLEALLESERSADYEFAVLFVDLDNFKQINDAYGHLVGDGVLGQVACRLSHCVRDGDYVVRYGGDEFVVLIERLADRRDIQPVVDRIHQALEEPVELPHGNVQLSVSIGVAEASPEYRSPEDLLAAADRDMYASKRLRS